jgi:acetoin:2,6-dichlorophenolindophenol oxidoreductase subunit beta
MIGSGFGGLSPTAAEAFAPLHRDFAARIMDVPVSELALAGAGIGAALAGYRPIVNLSTGPFIFHAFPQVVNEAPNIYYDTGGQTSVPVTFYSLAGIRGSGAAQHSQPTHGILGNTPGLQILMPGSPGDVYALLKWALLESENPTAFLNHPLLFSEEEDVDFDGDRLPIGRARVRREGSDLTIVAVSIMVPRSLQAAEVLAQEHQISAEVIDLRTLAPLDKETIVQSVQKTGRALVMDECPKSFGAAAELSAIIIEEAFSSLKAPVYRVTTPDVRIPYSPVLENEVIKTPDEIVSATLGLMTGQDQAKDPAVRRVL